MKHFFYSYNAISYPNGILQGLLDKYMNQNVSEQEKLKILYDLTDVIADKRFEDSDKELEEFVKKPTDDSEMCLIRRFCKLLPSLKEENGCKESYRIIALRRIWQYIEKEFDKYKSKQRILETKQHNKLFNLPLYHLVSGNICLRISQRYYENNDLEESEVWGEKAIELLWHGKNLAANLRNNSNLNQEERVQADLYIRLIKLNLAKYFRDYARRNRRSDFDAALDEFKQIRKRVEEEIPKTDNPEQKRQYVLIWIDTIFHIAKIHRRKYQAKTAKYEMQFFYQRIMDQIKKNDKNFCCISFPKQDPSFEFIEKLDFLICEDLDEKEKENMLIDLDAIDKDSFAKCSYLDPYDRKRYLLLALLEISRIRRDLHMPDNYLKAMATAIVADTWSYEMDKRNGYNPGHNIDALITISSSLRKYVKFQDFVNGDEFPLKELVIEIGDWKYPLFLRNDKIISEMPSNLNSFIKKLQEYANKGHMKSKSEIIKWHCLYQQRPVLLNSIEELVGEYNTIQLFFDDNNENLQFQFLKGFVMYYSGQYKIAVELFEQMISSNSRGIQYIRQGTIGLKARYLLANCYMALTEYSKAESILWDLHEKLDFAKKSRMVQWETKIASSDAEPDVRVEIDLGYCYMQRGDYRKAFEIYYNLFGNGERKGGKLNFNIPRVKKERCILGLNHYAACCIFSIKEREAVSREKIETARRIFIYMDRNFFNCAGEKEANHEYNQKTSLLKGYYSLLMGSAPAENSSLKKQIEYCKKITSPGKIEASKESLIIAHKYFRNAARFNAGFPSHYNLVDGGKTGNRAAYRDEVESISAYIISLVKLWEKYIECSEKEKKSEKAIKDDENIFLTNSGLNLERFLLGFPTNYEISLKAAMDLAEWLLRYETVKGGTGKRLIDQLYRSFSYLTIYEERGARVFNILRDNNKFRFFTAAQRGKLLAYLLFMYKPIKTIKEECCLNITDMEKMKHLVHYTSVDSLKKILTCDDANSNTSFKPRFRILNCGYMNDVFEGNTFLKGIEMVSDIEDSETKKIQEYKEFIKSYFPQLNRSHEDMLPSGSSVYIGSLSVKPDSFPMWSVYAKNESGCNIEFGDRFFDIKGNSCFPGVLREYMISKYTDHDYPLYIVQYLGKQFSASYSHKSFVEKADFEIKNVKGFEQICGTEAIDYEDLYLLLKQIYKRWKLLDEYLEADDKNDVDVKCKNVIRAFAADRINEIRFLFKDSDYEFEGEVRVIYTDFTNPSVSKIDMNGEVPKVYIELNRELKDLTVRLGSRIEDATVDKYVTWLKHTGRVKKIGLASRNRYTT